MIRLVEIKNHIYQSESWVTAMQLSTKLNAKKLLHIKWTADSPVNKEKHFIISQVIALDFPNTAIEFIELEVVYSQRKQILSWQSLSNHQVWKQGWC